jgi:hypothetical protein
LPSYSIEWSRLHDRNFNEAEAAARTWLQQKIGELEAAAAVEKGLPG